MRVTEQQRRDNLYWVRQRDRWREQYKKLQTEINQCKAKISYLHSGGHTTTANKFNIQLRALQQFANIMMIERSEITMGLKLTSYRYED